MQNYKPSFHKASLSTQQTTMGQLGLLEKEFKLLEAWVRDYAQKQQDKLTKNLWEDLSEAEPRWACQEKQDVLATLQEASEKKVIYMHSLLQKMEDEILGAPAAVSKDDADSIDSRQFKSGNSTEPMMKQSLPL